MTNILPFPREKAPKPPSRKRKKQQVKDQTQERVALIDSIKLTQGLLKEAYASFHQATDPDLVESYVYEINALKARHNFLSKQLREPEHYGTSTTQSSKP